MASDEDLWFRGAQADFQAVGHKGPRIAELQTMCLQIEDMVQSIALGLTGITEVLRAMKTRVDHIERWVQVQQAQQDQSVEQPPLLISPPQADLTPPLPADDADLKCMSIEQACNV
jgi:hypothetical protein